MAGRFAGLTDAAQGLVNALPQLLAAGSDGAVFCKAGNGRQKAQAAAISSYGSPISSRRLFPDLLKTRGRSAGIQGRLTAFFPPGKDGGTEAAYGNEGKGGLIALIADDEGMSLPACSAPADEDARTMAGQLLDLLDVKTGTSGRPPERLRSIAADKGDGSDPLREFLKKRGSKPHKKNAGKRRGQQMQHERPASSS